jgi:hypothetical protein
MILITRVASTEQGTFGVLSVNGLPESVTLEDPWNFNRPGISCIPPGTYPVGPHFGTKYKDVWILKNTGNRIGILIHAGNTINDTSGCILVGKNFAQFGKLRGIEHSKEALKHLQLILPKNFELKIINAY